MAGRHWTGEELIGRLYGIGPGDGHLEECAECSERWQRLLIARSEVLQVPHVPEDLLIRQRRAVYDQLEQPRRAWRPAFAHAVAVAMLLVLAILMLRPALTPQPTRASSDTQLFSEVYSEIQSTEPDAVAPIRGLFEVTE